jgi:hypothetical protein
MRHALSGTAIDQTDVFLLESLRRKGIIVKIEAAGQPPAPVEHERAHHGSGRIACLLESLGHGAKFVGQRLPGEVLHAVLKRVGAGQDHRMRRPGQGNLRDRALKHHAVQSQPI